ncbi:MAG TPA: Pecanex-like protein 1, partial [Micromonosporaceae bacterium]|nr:Pecanex-like protein 1 [Micromonosporaceae bacterium]
MRKSAQRGSTTGGRGNRRVLAALAAFVVIGGMIAVTQVSNAATRRQQRTAAVAANCAPAGTSGRVDTKRDLGTPDDGTVRNYRDDQGNAPTGRRGEATPTGETRARRSAVTPTSEPPARRGAATPTSEPPARRGAATPTSAPASGRATDRAPKPAGSASGTGKASEPAPSCPPGTAQAETAAEENGLEVLGDDCGGSKLGKHDGFQKGNRCVDTQFGEVGNAANNPSLLITDAPETVKVGQAFTISVATRNLVRDRFLGAAAGGYYLESSFLTSEGLVRGHFHTACRMLSSEDNAPDPAPAPAFFVATEDGKGGKNSDTLKIQ